MIFDEVSVENVGDASFQGAARLGGCLSLTEFALVVDTAGAGIAGLDQRDGVQGGVQLSVAGGIESVAAVKREKGSLDVLWASAGGGEPALLGEITEAQFDTWFGLNARGTLFTVQKALPLFNDGGSILMTRARVHRWSSVQPCAAGPRSNSARNRRTWSGESRERFPPGPVEARAVIPPARQRRRHW
ncbi:SDR family oxidoreductase [Plantactinospora sp. DSM 117369]